MQCCRPEIWNVIETRCSVTEREHIDKEDLITGRKAVWKRSVAHTISGKKINPGTSVLKIMEYIGSEYRRDYQFVIKAPLWIMCFILNISGLF